MNTSRRHRFPESWTRGEPLRIYSSNSMGRLVVVRDRKPPETGDVMRRNEEFILFDSRTAYDDFMAWWSGGP